MKILRRGRLLWGRVAPWLRRYKIPLLLAGGALLVFVLTVQLLHPEGQALPRAKLADQNVGGATYDELVEGIKTGFRETEVAVSAGEKSKAVPLSQLGASVEAENMARNLLAYPLWQRLIPLTILRQPQVHELEMTLNQEQLEEASNATAEELSVPATDARLTISEGELSTTPAKAGQAVTTETVVETLSGSAFYFGMTTIEVAAEERAPMVSDEAIAAIRDQAEEIIRRQIVIVAEDGTEFIPEPADIASWLTVSTSEENEPELAIDQEQLSAYIDELNASVGVRPGTAVATVVDGEETTRTSAPSGLAIAADELSEAIRGALFDESASTRLAIRMVEVPPTIEYNRSYTSSQKGLRAYVEYVASSENIRIAVSQTGGKRWSAAGRADEQTIAASTYKLYVAYMLFKQVADNKLEWSDEVLDTDVAGCLERMIVVSDNACAEEFIEMFGGKAINEYLYANGISRNTTLISEEGVAKTTASDLAVLLRGLENGSMIKGNDRSRLLNMMEHQRYRAGVPAGSGGDVYDKVGFLWEYLNDAAIVRHPKGSYVIAVLSKDASWGKIAEITRQIEQIMYS